MPLFVRANHAAQRQAMESVKRSQLWDNGGERGSASGVDRCTLKALAWAPQGKDVISDAQRDHGALDGGLAFALSQAISRRVAERCCFGGYVDGGVADGVYA